MNETSGVLFSAGIPKPNNGGGLYEWLTGYPVNVTEYSTTPVNLYMDIFEPGADTLSNRPLIIICFGGAFVSGSKDHWSIRLLAEELARCGFVTATIDYRLGMNIFNADLAMRAVYRGVQDGRSAVRFFRADAAGPNIYRIDPDEVYIGGHSSGGFIALHNAYLETELERPISTYIWPQGSNICPDQLCLDCVGENQSFSGHANAIFSLAGALGFTDLIDTNADPRPVMFHSTDDETVPYDTGEPLSSITWAVSGSDLPIVYGSLPISLRWDTIGLSNNFFFYTNRGHAVHEASESELHHDIVPGIRDWFYTQRLKPPLHTLSGPEALCPNASTQTYSVEEGLASYFDWQVEGGVLIDPDPLSSLITVDWDPNAPVRQLSVTPYSQWEARGDSVSLEINIAGNEENRWSGMSGGSWNDPANWDLGHIPLPCEEVVFLDAAEEMIIEVDSGQLNVIKTLLAGQNVEIRITTGAELLLKGN